MIPVYPQTLLQGSTTTKTDKHTITITTTRTTSPAQCGKGTDSVPFGQVPQHAPEGIKGR